MREDVYFSTTLQIYEWPQPMCEIAGKEGTVLVKTKNDAIALIKSLSALIQRIEELQEEEV
jgi:hypothetical protein